MLSWRRRHYVAIVSIFLIMLVMVALIAGMVGCVGPEPLGHLYPCEEDLIEVMFATDSKVRLRDGAPVDLATNALAGVDDILQELDWSEWYRICDVPEEMLDEIQAHGEANTGEPVYNLNNIYRLRIPMGLDVWAISEELEALSGIMLARPVPEAVPLPQPPSYVPNQGYLRPASSTPAGINADYAWTQTGGNGAGVTVCDLEYSWNYNHADITKALGSQINPNPIIDPFSTLDPFSNHGTAVIGELVSDNNGWGATGICYGASLKTCGVNEVSLGYNVAGAIAYAIANLKPGDVILLEQQWDYTLPVDATQQGCIPIEWCYSMYPNPQLFNPVYAAIVNAVSNGIHVVEAGGNGNVNTDNLTWYGDSGAIIVGAGNPLERLSFSSYGSRFDLQGWGHNVVTTGYGDLYNSAGVNFFYTSTFSGTSSASPIVAGAVAVVEGNRLARGLPTLSPAAMRSLLVATGTPQKLSVAGNIGPLPDLARALTQYYLTVGSSADGSVTVQPPAPGPYAAGTIVTLTAIPNAGYRFWNWTGDVGTIANVNAASTTITMSGDYSITASFEKVLECTPMVAAGYLHTVGLKADGTVVAVGGNDYGQCNVGGWPGIVQVAAGVHHTVGLRPDGTVVAVGGNDYGQCNVGGWTDIVQVAAGDLHTVGLKSDGTVVAVGSNSYGDGQCNVGGWTGIVQVAAGWHHTVGLKSDGAVVAVGDNGAGQCNVGGWTGINQTAAGGYHTVGLKSDGTVVAVGSNSYGQCNVGGWTNIAQVAAGHDHTVGLKSDGTVVAVGCDYNGQCNVGGWTNITQVSAGGWHTVGLRSDGTVVAVGRNDYGQCEVGGWTLN